MADKNNRKLKDNSLFIVPQTEPTSQRFALPATPEANQLTLTAFLPTGGGQGGCQLYYPTEKGRLFCELLTCQPVYLP